MITIQDNLQVRASLRNEFLLLGMQQIIDALRKHDNPQLNNHLDLFEMVSMGEIQNCLSKRGFNLQLTRFA